MEKLSKCMYSVCEETNIDLFVFFSLSSSSLIHNQVIFLHFCPIEQKICIYRERERECFQF